MLRGGAVPDHVAARASSVIELEPVNATVQLNDTRFNSACRGRKASTLSRVRVLTSPAIGETIASHNVRSLCAQPGEAHSRLHYCGMGRLTIHAVAFAGSRHVDARQHARR